MNKDVLKSKIISANKSYREGEAIMSDRDYDNLLEQYKTLVSNDGYVKFLTTLHEAKGKIKHPYVMGSLTKYKYEEPETIEKFIESHCNGGINISAKVDGISCRLHYENGKLVSASTRGDGYYGEDLTDKIQYVKCVPKILGTGKGGDLVKSIDIRGELVILKDDFATMTGYANARNACAGIMNRKDFKPEDVSKVTFVAYTVLGQKFPKDMQFALLGSWGGFKVAWNINYSSKYYFKDRCLSAADELFSLAKQDFEYETDGLVICGNLYRNEDKYYPTACCAFKTNQLSAITRVIDVEFDGPSKDGYFIPIAILEPVELGGSTISRATLHNLNFLYNKGIKYGSKVSIVKSGDIIPKVVQVLENANSCTNIVFPKTCSCCGTTLIQDGVESLNLRCTNKNCNAQRIHKITRFVRNLGVKGASNKTLENFGIFCVDDLLKFRPNTAYKSEVKFYNEILSKVFTRSKKDLIVATDVQDLGEKTLTKIIDFYELEKLIIVSKTQTHPLLHPDGVGALTVNKFLDAFPDILDNVEKIINDERYNYVETSLETSSDIKNVVGSVCFTGKLNTMSRSQASKLAEQNGYEVRGAVNKGLTYLVTNDPNSGSSKNRKAKELGTKVITEEEFLKLCESSETDIMDL